MRRVLHEAAEEDVTDEMTAYTGCPLCNLNNIVFFIGIASALIHVLEFFAFWYLLAAFFIITTDLPKSDDQFWGVLYPALLIFHTIIQVAFSVLLIVGVLKKRKAYILPWIITSIIECAVLFKSSIFLGLQSVPASAWIIATTVAFFSVQLFYIACVILYFRRLKKMEREIQPPEVYKC
ncbi:unnamed protein product [Ixodes hexagonus]